MARKTLQNYKLYDVEREDFRRYFYKVLRSSWKRTLFELSNNYQYNFHRKISKALVKLAADIIGNLISRNFENTKKERNDLKEQLSYFRVSLKFT